MFRQKSKDITIVFSGHRDKIRKGGQKMFRKIFSRYGKIALVFTLLVTAFFISNPPSAKAAGYPTKPIELIVPFGAGGSTDLAARVLASVIPQYLGQPVVVVNKKGGGGQIGMNYVIKAKPDGYTMMEATIGPITIYPALHRKAPFTYNSMKAVARTELVPAVLVARPDKRWSNTKEFVDFVKGNPGALKYSIAGMGSLSDLGAKSFMAAAGIPMKNAIGVPFEGTAEALAALLGKHADYLYANLTPCIDHIKAGSLVALGISTPKRIKELPDVLTFTELGYSEANVMGWKGVAASPKLPDEIAKIWEDAVQKTVKDKAWLKFQNKLGSIPGYLGHADFTAFVEKEFKKFRKLAMENDLLID
jgi:tripartite-type tricarboxylate transporter receptor subunit TctC